MVGPSGIFYFKFSEHRILIITSFRGIFTAFTGGNSENWKIVIYTSILAVSDGFSNFLKFSSAAADFKLVSYLRKDEIN